VCGQTTGNPARHDTSAEEWRSGPECRELISKAQLLRMIAFVRFRMFTPISHLNIHFLIKLKTLRITNPFIPSASCRVRSRTLTQMDQSSRCKECQNKPAGRFPRGEDVTWIGRSLLAFPRHGWLKVKGIKKSWEWTNSKSQRELRC
jgi:hypothetical protein